MNVKKLIERLQVMPQDAEVFAIEPKSGEFKRVIDCESDFVDVVSLGLEK